MIAKAPTIICAVFAVLAIPSVAAADSVTDVRATLSALLAARGPQPVTVHRIVQQTHEHCGTGRGDHECYPVTVNVDVQSTTFQPWSAQTIEVVSSAPIVFGVVNRTDLPSQMTAIAQEELNCTLAAAGMSVSISTNVSHTEGVTITQGVTHTQGGTIGLSVPIHGVTVTGSVNMSDSSTAGTAHAESTTISNTRTGSGNIQVGPRSKIVGELRIWPVSFSIPFETTVTIDGTLSANDKYSRISQVLDIGARTFPVKGVITTTEASQGSLVFYEAPFSRDDCPTGAKTIQRPYMPQSNTILRRRGAGIGSMSPA